MTAIRTNVTGIQTEEEKKPDSATQGATQTTTTQPTITGIQAAPAPPPPAPEVVAPIQVTRTTQPDVTGIQTTPPVTPTPRDVTPIAPPTDDVLQPIRQPAPTAAPTPEVAPVVKKARPQLDFSVVEDRLEGINKQEIDQAKKQEAQDSSQIKNAFSHLLSQGKDSGFINAKNMAAVRGAAFQRYNAVTASNARFANEMVSVAKDKAKSDFDFDTQQWTSEVNAGVEAVNTLMEDPTTAAQGIELAQMYAGIYGGPFEAYNLPSYTNALLLGADEDMSLSFNKNTVQRINEIALKPSEGFDLSLDKAEMIRALTAAGDMGEGFVVDFMLSTPETDYEELGISKEVVDGIRDGSLSLKDELVQDEFTEGYRNYRQKELRRESNAAIYGDITTKYSGSDAALGVVNAFTDSNYGDDGTIQLDGDSLTTYDIPINPKELDEALIFDASFTDWDNNDYSGTWRKGDVGEMPVDGFEGLGIEQAYTNEELDQRYEEYHNVMSKEWKDVKRSGTPEQILAFKGNLLNQSQFKDEIVKTLRQGQDSGDSSVNRTSVFDKIMEKEAAITTGGVVQDAVTGTEVNYEDIGDFGINISSFDEREKRDLDEILADGGQKPISASTAERLLIADPAIFETLAENGTLLSTDVRGEDFNTSIDSHGRTQLPAQTNKDNIFTGAPMWDLIDKMDGTGSTQVMLDGVLYNVSAEPSSHDIQGRDDKGTISWTIKPVGGTVDGERTFEGEITTRDGGELKTREAKDFAKNILSGKIKSPVHQN